MVRRLVGDDRDTTQAADEQLQRLNERVRRYRNVFPPLRKLIGKERVGAKVRKRDERAQTPDQRLVASGVLREAQQKSLEQLSLSLNPLALRAPIDAALEVLWQLAERGRRPDRDTEVPSLSAS